MRLKSIRVGELYTDNKQGIREVLEIGQHICTYGTDPNAMGVRYRVLASAKQPDVGSVSEVELKSLASWAQSQISQIEMEAFILQQSALRVHKRLTPAQKGFLSSFDGDTGPKDAVVCDLRELRVAKACFEKGLLSALPAPSKADRHFDVRFSPLGLAVLKLVHETPSL